MEFARASSSSQTQDECETSARSFFFCVWLVERGQSIGSENTRGKIVESVQKSIENRRNFNESSILGGLGAQGSFRHAFGMALGRQLGPSWPASWLVWPPSWRFGVPSWLSRVPGWPAGVASQPLSSALPAQTPLRAAFEASFRPMWRRVRKPRSLKFVRPRNVS